MGFNKKSLLISVCLFSLSALVACSSDSDDLNLDGAYSLTATALTEVDINGGTCGDGTGEFTVSEGVLGGTVLSTNGNLFDVSGTVAANGDISGGFAQSGEFLVDFVGSLSGSGGSGTWEDVLECSGEWEAVKQ